MAAPPLPQVDVTSHINALVSVLVSAIGLVLFLFWRMFTAIQKKLDEICKAHANLPKEYVGKEEFGEWKSGRKDIWDVVNKHSHDPQGRVVR